MEARQAVVSSAIFLLFILFTGAKKIEFDELPSSLRFLYTSDFDNWEPPNEFYQNYTYYLSGYDEDGRPVWVLELGKWDIKRAMNMGEDVKKNLGKYVDQAIYRGLQSIGVVENEEEIREVIIIFDMEGYNLDQLNSLSAVGFILDKVRLALAAAHFLDVAYVINTNFVAETLVNIAKPVLGKEFAKLEIYGTNAARWRSVFRRKIPADQLPEWYGGIKDFKPLLVYG